MVRSSVFMSSLFNISKHNVTNDDDDDDDDVDVFAQVGDFMFF